MKSASRADIPPFYVMEVMKAAAERERQSGDVLHLEVGQPSTPAPRSVRAAAARALESNRLGYTDATGIPELRELIARHYGDRYDVEVSADRIVVTMGASGSFVLAFLAAFDVGDRVAVTEPGYPCYRNTLEAFGVEVVPIPVGPDTRFVPNSSLLAAAGPLDGLMIASPANPTGTALRPPELEDIAGYCSSRNVLLIADEIYHGIEYGERVPTALAFAPDSVVLQSFSKYYSMTGWRLGWLVLPEHLVRPVERLAQNLFISPPTLSQYAALAAFDAAEELDANVARYATNRRVLLDGLGRVGLDHFASPDGAFYFYIDVSHLTDDSQELCRIWLDELGVACTPGIDFDPVGGHRYVRLSYSESTADIIEATERIAGWVAVREMAD
ncbi:MAG: aminotransferase class I/II-fold pyridoxal phosphate-dependent enzyme [Acidimicrobiia bacterium]|nr:aminotransferase class I/II-fold pyridoxal phosphate-dependent enzyme [Acidimicrobiia bacterium]